MRMPVCIGLYWGFLLFAPFGIGAERFTVASYNVENFLTEPAQGRRIKSAESQAAVVNVLKVINADVVALQEMGSTNALETLRARLASVGMNYPHFAWEAGHDGVIHLAVLSRYPIVRRVSHTNDSFLVEGKRRRVKRGLLEVEIEVNADYRFTLINAHLKSKRPVPFGDEAALRRGEAKVLRGKVEALLAKDATANVLVLGDLNDTPDSRPLKLFLGGRKKLLHDLRPVERDVASPVIGSSREDIVWTYYYRQQDSYSRFDYLLASPGMTREWIPEGSYVAAMNGWERASDHRPVIGEFSAEDR